MKITFAVLILSCLCGTFAKSLKVTPCKVSDEKCLLQAAQAALPQILSPEPEIGAENMDPMFVKELVSNLSGLIYTFRDTTVVGYKNCVFKSIKLEEDLENMKFEVLCPSNMTGQYEVNGMLFLLPVRGSGDYKIQSRMTLSTVEVAMKKVTNNGVTHLSIKNIKVQSEAAEPVSLQFNNLFDGDEALAKPVLDFANGNYKEVIKQLGGELYTTPIKKIIKNVNKYLKVTPLEDLVAN